MPQGYKITFQPEAEAWMRAQPADMAVGHIRDGLAQFMSPVPSWAVVQHWLARNAPRARNVKTAIYQDDWMTAEVREWLRPRWHAGLSSAALADGVSTMTGEFPSTKGVAKACLRTFGPRVTPISLGRPTKEKTETRVRRCCRCREVKTLPRFVFTCAPCTRAAPSLGAPDGYRAVGVRGI